MTTTETLEAPATTASDSIKGNPWHPTFRGVALATRIELLRRRPSKKGYLVYGITVALIVGLGILVAISSDEKLNSNPMELVMILVLGAGMLIGPSLSATSINGDSSEGVLAPLQMSRLSAADLALGKLFASWAVCFAALLTTTPFLLYAFSKSGWHFDEMLWVLGVILFVVLAFTAMGLAWSSIAARSVASVSLTHITSGILGLGTLLIFAFSMPLVSEQQTVTYWDHDYEQATEEDWSDPNFSPSQLPCVPTESTEMVTHTDKLAWLLLINPAVVVVETAPVIDVETFQADGRAAPGVFAFLHQGVSEARSEPIVERNFCEAGGQGMTWDEQQRAMGLVKPNPWPGIALAGGILVASMAIVVQRLRVPYKKLRVGTRVA